MMEPRFYATRDWRQLSRKFRRFNPRCRRCGGKAQHVDHIIDIRSAPELRLEWTNLQGLCAACHNEKTAADRAGRAVRPHAGCDVEGRPLDPRHPWRASR